MLLVATHPVQYAAPVFRLLARHPKLDILVAYCSLQGAEAAVDPEFGIEVKWDVPLLDGYPWVHVPNRSLRPGLGRFFGLWNPGLWKLVRGGGFDAVVLYTGYRYASFWAALAAAKRSGAAVLFGTDATTLRPRNGASWKQHVKAAVWPGLYALADVVITPSSAKSELMRVLGIPADRIALTPFVVDNEWWTARAAEADRGATRAKWGIPPDSLVVLFCAKLQPWKRPRDMLRAFAAASVRGSRLVFAGEGPLHNALSAEARELGIADHVLFLGFVNQSELPRVYKAADLYVLPSEYDACPAAVCECMLCGCPPAISDEIRGRFDIVQLGETGFIYPCGDVEALAAVLRDALADPERLRRMGEAARRRMQTWSPRENAEALVQAVEKAVALKNGGRS